MGIKFYSKDYSPLLEFHQIFNPCLQHLIDQETKSQSFVQRFFQFFNKKYDEYFIPKLGMRINCETYINNLISKEYLSNKKLHISSIKNLLKSNENKTKDTKIRQNDNEKNENDDDKHDHSHNFLQLKHKHTHSSPKMKNNDSPRDGKSHAIDKNSIEEKETLLKNVNEKIHSNTIEGKMTYENNNKSVEKKLKRGDIEAKETLRENNRKIDNNTIEGKESYKENNKRLEKKISQRRYRS